MNFFTNLFSFNKPVNTTPVVITKTQLDLIVDAIEFAKQDKMRDCAFISISSDDYELPAGPVDLTIKDSVYSVPSTRIDYAWSLMIELEQLGYYAAVNEGNKTTRLFSTIFVML